MQTMKAEFKLSVFVSGAEKRLLQIQQKQLKLIVLRLPKSCANYTTIEILRNGTKLTE